MYNIDFFGLLESCLFLGDFILLLVITESFFILEFTEFDSGLLINNYPVPIGASQPTYDSTFLGGADLFLISIIFF